MNARRNFLKQLGVFSAATVATTGITIATEPAKEQTDTPPEPAEPVKPPPAQRVKLEGNPPYILNRMVRSIQFFRKKIQWREHGEGHLLVGPYSWSFFCLTPRELEYECHRFTHNLQELCKFFGVEVEFDEDYEATFYRVLA